MTKRNLLTLGGLALACGLAAWFVGRQITLNDSAPAAAAAQPSAQGPSPSLKPLTKIAAGSKAPATPAHEKAFLEEQLKTKPGHPPILLRLAELERSEGKLAEARKHLEQAVQGDPALIDARLELSLVCYQLGDVATAEKENQAVLKQDPKQADALYNLGAIYANQNKVVEARQYWTDAVKWGADTASGKNAASALTKLQ